MFLRKLLELYLKNAILLKQRKQELGEKLTDRKCRKGFDAPKGLQLRKNVILNLRRKEIGITQRTVLTFKLNLVKILIKTK